MRPSFWRFLYLGATRLNDSHSRARLWGSVLADGHLTHHHTPGRFPAEGPEEVGDVQGRAMNVAIVATNHREESEHETEESPSEPRRWYEAIRPTKPARDSILICPFPLTPRTEGVSDLG